MLLNVNGYPFGDVNIDFRFSVRNKYFWYCDKNEKKKKMKNTSEMPVYITLNTCACELGTVLFPSLNLGRHFFVKNKA